MSNTTAVANGSKQSKNSLNKTIALLKKRFFVWLRTILNIVHNNTEMQKVINHQNKELNEMRLLVNFLLKNTNRTIRRRWVRYLDAAQEIGIWDAEIVKLCPSDPKPSLEEIEEFEQDTEVNFIDYPNPKPLIPLDQEDMRIL